MIDIEQIKQTANEYIEGLVLTSEPLMPKWNRENYIFRKEPKWNYMDSCMMRAILMYKGEKNIEYAVKFMNSYVKKDGTIPTMKAEDFNLDNICGGMTLLELYEITGDERYILACHKLYEEQLSKQPKLDCGCYWHKAVYPNQTWLDGVYMVFPFQARYAIKTGRDELVTDALKQVMCIKERMRDEASGLYFHGYNETRDMFWADKNTGLSKEIWLRSNGWLCAGLADLYEITGENSVGEMLRDLVDSLTKFVTAEGMLLQLPLHPELEKNYPETSGTLLFSYAAMKGHRLGAVSKAASDLGKKALQTVTEKYISHENGIPVLKNICLMGGLGGAENRDGSAEYYLSERIVENEAKGIAPYLFAANEAIFLK